MVEQVLLVQMNLNLCHKFEQQNCQQPPGEAYPGKSLAGSLAEMV